MARFKVPWPSGLTAGAVGVAAIVVVLVATERTNGVDPDGSQVSAPHVRDVVPVRGRPAPVAVERAQAARKVGRGLESHPSGPEFADSDIGVYVDPDGAVVPSTMADGFIVADEAYQDPEHDRPVPDPREPGLLVGEYLDPGDAQ